VLATEAPAGAKRCEEVGVGYCTPGAAPCRVAGSADFPLASAEDAAKTIVLPLASSSSGPAAAFAEGGNVYVRGSGDTSRHLVCEVMQLAPGRATAGETIYGCLHDPSYTPAPAVGGWCYSTDPAVIGATCLARGTTGKVHVVGDATPRPGSEVFMMCKK
jgi:hypothetical protein